MTYFLNTCFEVKKIIQNDSILLDRDYQSFELAQGYRIEQWRNDPAVDVESKRKFRTLLNKSVVYNSKEFEKDGDFGAEFQCHGHSSKGCLLVYEMDGVAVSFLSRECWKLPEIEGEYLELLDDGTLEQCQVKIPNVSFDENVELFKSYYEKKREEWRYTNIVSGQDILKIAETVFPNLVFCENAIQGCRRDVGVSEAGQVYKRLLELQRAAETMGNKFDRDSLTKATPESGATLERFSEEHTFCLPDGGEQIFSWHTRYTGGYAGRIFFHPRPESKTIYIGHVGHKLPTVKYH
ncbi:MAG: hypothetical protein KH452_13710 [Clostridiales bacterium]|nr:hypothetical protein [Clostridiales bacterium]